MFNIIKRRSTHASKLERWIGPNKAAELSALHKDWYGPPIALADVPGEVYCRGGGDFVGNIDAGGFQNYWDFSIECVNRKLHQAFLYNKSQMATGFATLAALQQAGQNGYLQRINILHTVGGSNSAGYDSWQTGVPIGGAAAAAPGGTVYSKSSAHASAFRDAGSGRTLTTVNADFTQTVSPQFSGLICDRLFAVAKTMSSTASEAVTGVPTRYQSTTITDPDWCGGNFCYPYVTSGLPATAHNHTVCQYTDQDGNTAQSFPSQAGVASAAALRVDLPNGVWFLPTDTNDVGVKSISQLQLSAAITGGLTYVLSHPLYWVLCPMQQDSGGAVKPQVGFGNNGINSAMQLVRVFNDAALYLYVPINSSGQTLQVLLDVVEG
jgi:hypothetical protein